MIMKHLVLYIPFFRKTKNMRVGMAHIALFS